MPRRGGKRSSSHHQPVGQKQKKEALRKKRLRKADQMRIQSYQKTLETQMQEGPKKRIKDEQKKSVRQITQKPTKAKAAQEKRTAAIQSRGKRGSHRQR